MAEPTNRKIRRHTLSPRVLVAAGFLVAAPFVALLWVGTYNSESPRLWGFPFFYWYQLLWVLIAGGTTFLAYLLVTRTGKDVDVDDERDEK